MAHWREEYLAALAVRDQREKANVALYDACLFLAAKAPVESWFLTDISSTIIDTRLADRTAQLATLKETGTTLEAGRRSSVALSESQQPVSSAPATASRKQAASETGPSLTELLKTTRAELSEAQRSREDLQNRLNRLNIDVEKLRKKSSQDSRRLNALESEKENLLKRLKDRDEELREKTKLLEDFQAELASLNLEFNMAEKKSNELQRENKELVDRWMARMGEEADAMNDASKFS
ncbi:Autophagy protein 16 [Penicillium canariense]|uniref:Autophagy protein 16 n=1 Tax=Penicillium canariense TaxID=189055 RepID=A0A9W9HW32_9EURO|nr:Autophagy protein 16 [Penicillium canariense]KAJ5160013.1 Autophagy protein 16 [Penicillium canariense]